MFTNSGITPNGRQFLRGEAVLVRYGAGTFTAFIDRINSPAGNLPDNEVTISVLIITGFLRTMDSTPVDPKFSETPVAYSDGYYHQSTKIRRGEQSQRPAFLFCFTDEEPVWLKPEENVTKPIPVVEIPTVDVGNNPNNPLPDTVEKFIKEETSSGEDKRWKKLNFKSKEDWIAAGRP